MSPGELRALVDGAASGPVDRSGPLLVGRRPATTPAVYQVSDELALVATTDFVTPVCDDHFCSARSPPQTPSPTSSRWAVAVAGAGGVRVSRALAPEVAAEICAGGDAKAREAGAVVGGGHTVRNSRLFYGLAVTGQIHPQKIVRNTGARVGDLLVLTKPVGSGLIIAGHRNGQISRRP